MKVRIPINSILEQIPELIPAFRQLGSDLPAEVDLEASLTPEALYEKELRDRFPIYWQEFTSTEWKIWVNLCNEGGGSRAELKALICAEVTRLSEEGYYEMSNVADVHVKNLRRKVIQIDDKYHIESKVGWGYLLKEGPEPIQERVERAQNVLDLLIPVQRREKQLSVDGLIRKPKRTSRVTLNAVEFSFLKEMKMDELSIEECARRLNLGVEYLRRAWEAPSFSKYLGSNRIDNTVFMLREVPKKETELLEVSPPEEVEEWEDPLAVAGGVGI